MQIVSARSLSYRTGRVAIQPCNAKLLRIITILCLYLGLATPTWALPYTSVQHSSIQQPSSYVLTSAYTYSYSHYEPTLSRFPQLTVEPGKKPSILPKQAEKKSAPSKVHPRKKLLEEAPRYTQRAWLYSAVVPGLGQLYNKSYWEIPVIYGVFGLLAWGAIYNHDAYMTSKRELLDKCRPKGRKAANESSFPNLVNYMEGRKRDRTIFVASMFVWYLLNVFEAYVGGTLKTFDVSDDLEVVIEPNSNSSSLQNASIGLSISLQSK